MLQRSLCHLAVRSILKGRGRNNPGPNNVWAVPGTVHGINNGKLLSRQQLLIIANKVISFCSLPGRPQTNYSNPPI